MTSIEQIQISGIRSFDPNPANRQTIVFQKPLTVILGKNGAGKTTIIEALLNACTGTMPPGIGTEKSSFIYDPKTVAETEVKAQIRLLFTGKGGRAMQVIRSFQATQSPAKTTFTTLDNTIAYQDPSTGKVVSSTYRSSDVDRLVPEALGVSASVLENVIFCHQEDCNWPLSAPKDVKRIFDDIFSATRYVLALDRLRENGKEFRHQQKQHEAMLLMLREHRDQAKQLEADIAARNEAVKAIEQRRKGIDPQLQELRHAAVAFDSIQEAAEQLAKDAAVLQGRIEEKQLAMGRENVAVSPNTLEELLEAKRTFAEQVHQLEEAIAQKLQQLSRLEEKRRSGSEQFFAQRSKLQQLEQREAQFKHACDEINRWMETSALSASLVRPGDPAFGESDLRALLDAAAELVTSNRNTLEVKRLRYHEKHRELAEARNSAMRQVDADNAEAALLEKHVADCRGRLQEAQESLASALPIVAEDQIQQLERKIAHLSSQIEDEQAARKGGESYKQAEDLIRGIEVCNRNIAQLRQRISRMMKTSDASEIAFLRKRVEEIEENIQKELTQAVLPALAELGWESVLPNCASVATAAEQLKAQNIHALASVEDAQRRLDREVAGLQHQRRQIIEEHAIEEQQLAEKREECARVLGPMGGLAAVSQAAKRAGSSTVRDAIIGDQDGGACAVDEDDESPVANKAVCPAFPAFDHLLAKARATCCELRRKYSSMEAMALCYAEFAHVAKKDHKCAVCDRPFTTSTAMRTFLETNTDRQKDSPESMQRVRQQLEDAEASVRRLESIEGHVVDIRRHEERQLAEARRLSMVAQSISEKEAEVAALATRQRSLRDTAAGIDRVFTGVATLGVLTAEADRLNATLSRAEHEAKVTQQLAGDDGREHPPRTYDELSEEYESEMSRLQRLSEQLREVQRSKGEGAEAQAGALESERSKLHAQLCNLQVVRARQSGIRDTVDAASRSLSEYQRSLEDLQSKRTAHQRDAEQCSAAVSSAEASWGSEELPLVRLIRKAEEGKWLVESRLSPMEEFIRGGIAQQLQAVRSSLVSLEDGIQRSQEEEVRLQADIVSERRALVVKHDGYSLLEQQIRVAELQRSLDEDEGKLRDVERSLLELKGSKVTGVEALLETSIKGESMGRIRELLRSKISELERSYALQEGNLETIIQDVQQLKSQLEKDKYANIEKRYQSTFLKVQTTGLAVQDISKYYRALEKAVNSYHQEKIEQINEIIDKLWRQTYCGSDIDTIELRSEVEPTNLTRRSYSYRVVMKRGNSELDMRGRCSAGQKVLASIIIRLALSEAFCYNCGILALDEPTTNLDEDNARSLAESLRLLIDTRLAVKHSQFIVITHDEQFVRALGGHTVEKFYFIHKDREGAFSVIEERTFDQLFA